MVELRLVRLRTDVAHVADAHTRQIRSRLGQFLQYQPTPSLQLRQLLAHRWIGVPAVCDAAIGAVLPLIVEDVLGVVEYVGPSDPRTPLLLGHRLEQAGGNHIAQHHTGFHV